MRSALLLSLACALLSACATPARVVVAPSPALGIEAPPSGRLSADQLAAVARDIRRLEAAPFAADAADARRAVLTWITGSPDVSVTACGGVTGSLASSRSAFHTELFGQSLVSAAAYAIENPSATSADKQIAGIEGALVTYRAMLDQAGPGASDSFMDEMARERERGTLAATIRARTSGC